MTIPESPSFAPAHLVKAMDDGMAAAAEAGALMQTAGPSEYSGRHVDFAGRQLLNFGCCSYLGLEIRSDLKEGAIDATRRYGTQFPFPRAMLQNPLYRELEELLRTMTGGHIVVAASTSLAHISALPVLIEPGDAALIDVSAHASLHTASALLRGIPLEPLRHSRLDLLEKRIQVLSAKHRRVWYILDGLYSMVGDFAPIDELALLLQKYPALHVYVDDAHSTSWTGKHGRGYALERLTDRERVVGALSLNKAFSAAGGALVLPSEALANRVRRAGGPMVFSGAIQPPMLGAAVASAKIHVSPELETLQRGLATRIEATINRAAVHGVPLADTTPTPVFFVEAKTTEKAFSLTTALREEGFCVCASMFPIVPRNHAGIRFTISLHNELEDIENLMLALARQVKRLGLEPSTLHSLEPTG
jgi:7-keto-8-aminopelargonate synthetase-like enzyme